MALSIETERAAFEAYLLNKNWQAEDLFKWEDGHYCKANVNFCWIGWKASAQRFTDTEVETLIDLSEELIWAFVRNHLRRMREISSHWNPSDFRHGMDAVLDEMEIRLTPVAFQQSMIQPAQLQSKENV